MSDEQVKPESPAEQPSYSAWDVYLASLDDDSIDKLTVEGLDAARAWFGIGGVWTAEPIRAELSASKKEVERLGAELIRSKMTFFYIRNLSHEAWRDPANLEPICRRIEDYAKMEYDLLAEALSGSSDSTANKV